MDGLIRDGSDSVTECVDTHKQKRRKGRAKQPTLSASWSAATASSTGAIGKMNKSS